MGYELAGNTPLPVSSADKLSTPRLINGEPFDGTADITITAPETAASLGDLINSATSKATPVDADQVALMDSAAGNVLKKLSWANAKATLKTYFDTLYLALAGKAGGQTVAGGTGSGDNLTLQSTTHATKGKVILGTAAAYDEANTRLGIGTTTPNSALHVVGLPAYANNAAAVAGGLTAGAFYRTGGDPDLLCVVH